MYGFIIDLVEGLIEGHFMYQEHLDFLLTMRETTKLAIFTHMSVLGKVRTKLGFVLTVSVE